MTNCQGAVGTLDPRMDEQAFPGEYARMVGAVNAVVGSHVSTQLRLIDFIEHYAIGDLSVDMDRLPGQKAVMTSVMDGVKTRLSGINREIRQLADSAAAGDHTTRGDAAAYQHDFRIMVDGLQLPRSRPSPPRSAQPRRCVGPPLPARPARTGRSSDTGNVIGVTPGIPV